MDTFASSIKRKYRERLINREKQWPPCHSSKLVRLELVEAEKGEGYSASTQRGREDKTVKRMPLEYGDLFKVQESDFKRPDRKVLVEGDAGIGKTTLSVSISEDWANGKLFQQFELVLLLPLRYKEVAAACSITDLLGLLHSHKKLCSSVGDSLEEREGDKVLIIADGWDELGESGRLEGSFLYKLIFGECLPFVSVILTSRPSASAPLHKLPYIDRYVEVCGFSKDHIIEYIQSEFARDQKKADHLLVQLESNPLVESVCSVPLNCAIVCHLWHTLEEALPSTMTELYKKIILNVTYRNITKKDEFKHVKGLPDFSALPEALQQPWEVLCKFSFDSTVKDQIVFSEEELAHILPDGLEQILCFGLLQTANTVLETGYGMSFHFLHLTFQEYLAALYVVKQISDHPADLPIKQFDRYLVGPRSDHVVCRFICGIYFNETEQPQSTALQPFLSSSKEALSHCAFETMSKDFCCSTILGKMCDSEGTISCFARSAYSCDAALYVISNLQKGYVEINFYESGVRENQVRELTNILTSKCGMVQVNSLLLSCNKLTDRSVSELFNRASKSFQSLSLLYLQDNQIGQDSIISLSNSTSYHLSHLVLSDCPLGAAGMQALEDAVCTGALRGLVDLDLAGSLTSDADINGALLATCMGSIISCCPRLSYLYLSRNNLGVPGVSALASILCKRKQNSSQQEVHVASNVASVTSACKYSVINLNETSVGDKGMLALTECSKCLKVSLLALAGNSIHATGISLLVGGEYLWKISELHVRDNPLGLEGALALGRFISSSHCNLVSLQLSRCHLTKPEGELSCPDDSHNTPVGIIGKQLYRASTNYTVHSLYLNENSFTGEGIHILAGFMHLCWNLTILQSRGCDITSSDLKRLLDQLTNLKESSNISCSRLVMWDLSDNQLDDNGMNSLLDHLSSLFHNLDQHLRSSFGVAFSGNHVSSEFTRRIRKEKEERKKKAWRAIAGERDNILFETQWEEIVRRTANDLFSHPYHLVVIEQKEEDNSDYYPNSLTLGKSISEREDLIHMEDKQLPREVNDKFEYSSDSDSETFRTPPTSPTPANENKLPLEDETRDGSLPHSQSHACSSAPELKELDLLRLVNWHGVGLQLGIDDYELEKIRLNYQDLDDRKRAMFRVWLRACRNPNYHDLAKTLEVVGETTAAKQIRGDYL